MIAVWILLFIFLVLVLALFAKIQILVSYEKELQIKLKFGFLRFTLLPAKTKKKKRTNRKKATKTDEKVSKKNEPGVKPDYMKMLKNIQNAISPFIEIFKKFKRHVIIDPFGLRAVMVSDEPAALPIQYGAVCSVLYPALSMMNNWFDVKNMQVDLSVDYLKTDFELFFKTGVQFRLIYALHAVFGLLKQLVIFRQKFMKTRRKEEK